MATFNCFLPRTNTNQHEKNKKYHETNLRWIARFAVNFIFVFAAFSSCSDLEKFDKKELVITGKEATHTITVELAKTDVQQSQGLMYRKKIKDGEGMLFIFEWDRILSFWMKNTLVPLSIAYIASDGRIFEIYDLEPGNLNVVTSSRSGRYALEVPRGWFSRAGIGPGDKIDLSGL